jgi:peptidoglycan-associated lipoprotein
MMRALASTLCTLGLAAVAAVASACGSDKPQVKTADDSKSAPTASAKPANRLPDKAPDSPTASAVHISDEIVKACGISDADAYFAFDSSNLRTDDTRVLDQVAKCFMTGPLKGRTIKLVGHADPRGQSDYNMTLGQSRADSVKGYIIKQGMDAAKADSTTRGAMDAVGSDEPSWARDRRVDVMLGQ